MRVMRSGFSCWRIGGYVPSAFIGKEQDDRDEDDDGDDIAGGAESKRADIVHADALSDKSRSPDEGRNEQ